MAAAAAVAAARADCLGHQELANAVWALRVLRYRPSDAQLARLEAAAARLVGPGAGAMDARERATVARGFEELGWRLPG